METRIFDADGVLRGQEVGTVNDRSLPRIVSDLWFDGDEAERTEIDRRLERMRQREYASQATFFTF